MRILITGGAGFIGSHLTDTLLEHGHEVCVYDNLRTGSLANLEDARLNPQFSFRKADVLDSEALNVACREFAPSIIVHLAALVSVQDARNAPDLNFQLNVEATHRVISAAILAKASRVIFASSAAVYGDNPRIPLKETELPSPIGPYGGAKAASELLLAAAARDYGFESVSLRFFNVFGPRQRPDSPYSGVISIFTDRVRHQRPLTIFGDGHQTRDFVPVREVATAIKGAAEARAGFAGTFNVCSGHRTSLLDLVAHLEHASGRRVTVAHAPPRAGDIIHSNGDPTALESQIGFRPNGGLQAPLAELLH